MGNTTPSPTKPDQITYENFVANYTFLRKNKEPRYGDITILQDKETKDLYALKERTSRSTIEFNKDMGSLKTRSKITHPNIIKLIGYTYKAEENLCASFYKFLLIVEYIEHDLEIEIIQKKTDEKPYVEDQLWYIAESLVSALNILQQKNIEHGDIKPGNVLISNNGIYKIAEHNLIGTNTPSYHQRLSGFNDVKCYLSPLLMKSLQKQEIKPKHDPYKSDVFSLGMVLLNAATLQSCDRLYEWDNFTIDQREVDQRINALDNKYSESFQNLLNDMLNFNEDSRPDFILLNEKIQASAKNIIEPQIPAEKYPDKLVNGDVIVLILVNLKNIYLANSYSNECKTI